MKVYCVEYQTGYDYNEIIGYFLSETDAVACRDKANKDNPGLDAFVTSIDVE